MVQTHTEGTRSSSFSSIYENNMAWMVREARARCQDLAEDVVQDTFLSLLRRGQEVILQHMPVPDQMRFLRRCLLNQIQKEWTRSSRQRRGGGVVEWVSLQAAADHGHPIDLVDERHACHDDMQRATLEEMDAALAKLKQSMKWDAWHRVSIFFETGECQQPDLALHCHRSGALRTALSRARTKLRHILRSHQNS